MGFIPSEPGRLWGVQLLLAGLSHSSWMHLIANLYFFRVFGDNVEELLGHSRFLALILGTHLCGVALHGMVEATAARPVVGFSCAVSGVMAYYVIRYPRTGIFVWVVRWFLRVQAWAMMAVWLALQMRSAALQFAGLGCVSGM